ncbi:hypothetical protein FNYG_01212 [Fusarium nygamai]|uniref:Uncharacterized protein n=1 Tax=Gibberella nygamai TaxID=42673 RepID=A0A2K0WSW3_GIBNY|nr:hypothetical protein FNYG_01212 [Fusarium nygamai]
MLRILVAERASLETRSLLVPEMHSDTQIRHSAVSCTGDRLDNRGRMRLFGGDKARTLASYRYAE